MVIKEQNLLYIGAALYRFCYRHYILPLWLLKVFQDASLYIFYICTDWRSLTKFACLQLVYKFSVKYLWPKAGLTRFGSNFFLFFFFFRNAWVRPCKEILYTEYKTTQVSEVKYGF